MKITKAAIDSLTFSGPHEKAKDVRWDDALPGFGVRVWPSGARTFVFAYRIHGRQRYLTLGKFGPMTPDQARKAAHVAHGQVLQGQDPLAARQQARAGETMADLCDAFIERHARPRNKTWAKDRERMNAYVVPAWGSLKAKAVRRQDVAALHHKIGITLGHPTTANRVLALLSVMFQKARHWGFLEEGALNPVEGVDRFPEVKRRRFVSKDEMPKLAQSIDQEENVFVRALLWLYLFTGLRKTELQSLRWKDVDLAGGMVTLEDTKAGRPHDLPLSTAAVWVFEQIPRVAGNPYVFVGKRRGRHLVNVSKPWLRIKERAELLDVRLHDLRRTVGSWLAISGASLPLIGSVLNHSNPQTTQVYARFSMDPVQEALEQHGRQIRAASGLQVLSPAAAAPKDG